MINWFLEKTSLRDVCDEDEKKTFAKEGIDIKAELATKLHPDNVAYEEIIREVMMCNHGTAPIADLFLNWVTTNPELRRLYRIAGEVVAAIAAESAKKAKQKDGFEPIPDE